MNLDSDIEEERKLKKAQANDQEDKVSTVSKKGSFQHEEDLGSPDFFEHMKELLTNPLFIFVTLSLCSVYFVVTGIQFWTTSYMLYVLKAD
jgi:sugar phosphate permease